ncbi:hypothetical protein ABRZ24_11225 [Brenneria populi]|uniref:Replication protein n=1 Tax=Brenneria populi TaxID=1505588 RepID=A0ABU6JQZ5_9GAMM|nr:replication protein [Brenneria populi Li et al. 2015]MEC5343163.1 hypothetical protein [Brenneria populi Li et al. 2015]QDX97005.1 hypothetical protein EGD00_07730 [Pectobacterium carotovorum subsp. carotovorum]
MSIDYNTIMNSSSEEVENYINRNHFTDKQKLEIYSFYNRNRKEKITVNVRKEHSSDIQPGIAYVHAFLDNLEKLGKNMSGAEYTIMIRLCKLMQHGNLIASISQSALAEELNMSKSNVCKCWKKLINKGILILDGKHTLINANLFLKGQYRTLNGTRKEYVKKSLRTTCEGVENVFSTVYKESIFINNKDAEEKTTKEDETPLLSAPDDDIDWDSVSENNMFNDYHEYINDNETI